MYRFLFVVFGLLCMFALLQVLSGCATVPTPTVPGGSVSVAYVQFIYVEGK